MEGHWITCYFKVNSGGLKMDLQQKLNEVSLDQAQAFPTQLTVCLEKAIRNETPKLVVSTDLNLSGQFEEQWIVVTDRSIFILQQPAPNDKVKIKSYSLAIVHKVDVKNYYGAGSVEIITSDGAIEILRFTQRFRKRFYKFADYLQKILKEEQFSVNEEIHENQGENMYGEDRCPNCGTPFTRGTTTCPKCSKKTATFKRLLSYLLPHKIKVALMLLTTLTYTVLSLVPPYLQKIMIDDVIRGSRLDMLKWIVLVILGTHILSALFQGLRSYQLAWLGQKIIYDLRSQVYAHLQSLGLAYYDRRQTGAIMNRVTGDTSSIQSFIVNGIQDTIVQIFTLVAIAVILFAQDWQLALIVLLPTPFIYFGTRSFGKRIHKLYHRIWRRRSNLSAVLGGAIPGIKVVKAFTQERYETEKFQEALDDYFREEIRAVKYRSTFFPLISLITSIGAVLIWGYGGYRVISVQDISLGTLTAFIGYMWRFYQPITTLSHLNEQFEGAVTAAERVFEILDHEPEFREVEPASRIIHVKGEIEFRNVSFYYNAGEEVLENINLHINAGELIGLVGSSGAGKSTLVNLIPRFYEATEGEIRIDGINIEDMDLNALRSNIGVVLQEPYLFYGTIAENISYGRPSASLEEIVWAARAANAHKFIMKFPDGYDTLIGERGVGLSGGEKQRISIARAILKNPRILILDEATSSVDTETEKLIQEAIDRLVHNRTTIAIAHRLSTLKNADRIIVLEKGTVVEEGTHNELMEKENGTFRHLVEIQAEIAKTKVV